MCKQIEDKMDEIRVETEKRTILNLLKIGGLTIENIAKAAESTIERVYTIARENYIELPCS